jgi:leucyl-tRNA synthetase
MARWTRCPPASSGCISRLPGPYREFANALADVLAKVGTPAPGLVWAVREASVILVQLFAPMMPHLAEECWQVLGRSDWFQANWPQIERFAG